MEQESESAVSWSKQNEMMVNADKFQAITLNKKESEAKYRLTIDNNDIESSQSVKLLHITIDMIANDLINTYQICAPKLQCN